MTLLPTPARTQNASPIGPANQRNFYEWNQGNTSTAGVGVPANSGLDIWGPLQRRKYLIALFCLIGAGLGYLYYSKTPKVYSSNTQLMISTQAPPSLVDGNFQIAQVSLPKHATLISSELILSNAAKDGQFDRMKTFSDTSYPVGALREMVRVIQGEKETLTIVCSGPNAEELPAILNQIVNSYENIIDEDSQTNGKQMMGLIQRLSDNISGEKDDADAERIRLLKSLGIQAVDVNGMAVNPYSKRLFALQDQQSQLKTELDDVVERYKLLDASLEKDKETGDPDPIHVKVAAIEAQKYLKLSRNAYKNQEIRHSNIVNLQSELNHRAKLDERILNLDREISTLKFERAKKSNVFAAGHSSIETIDQQVAFYQEEKQKFQEDMEKLDEYLESQRKLTQDNEVKSLTERDSRLDEKAFRDQEDREWIKLYELSLRQERKKLVTRVQKISEQVNDVSQKAESVAEGILDLNLLQAKIDKKDKAFNAIADRLEEMNILADNHTMTKVKVIDFPKHGRKIAPSLPKSLAVGSMLAFLAGLGLAILIDQSELAFRSPHEIFDRLQIPVVGRIPRINIRNTEGLKAHPSLIAAHKPNATASESFRDVRTGLFFRANVDDIKTVLFTSPSPGDGKSTTIANMAISIAQAGKRVILVDADFRRPRVNQYFGEQMEPGMLQVLGGEASLKQAIQTAEIQENLYLLTAGGRPANPGELVTSESFHELILALREKFDYVLIDSPPVLPVSDPATIASMVDAVYLVTRIRKGVKLTTQKAKESLDRVGANWMGVIVNGIDENPHYSEYGYQYGAYSYYGGVYGKYYDSRNKAYRDKISPEAPVKK